MKLKDFFLLFLLLPAAALFAQDKKELQAIRTSEEIIIDGVLDENAWQIAPSGKDFVTYSPTMGEKPAQPTEVKVVYDNRSIYFGVFLYESDPDSILMEYTKRDDAYNGNTDMFKISLNPYNDGQNIYQFEVTSANVQADSKNSSSSSSRSMWGHGGDYSWNAVWESSVRINDKGWVIEVKIPYAAIRFPKEDVQVWGINFWRTIRRIRETSTWNPVDRNFDEDNQDGELYGINAIKAPLRLELYPFAAGYYELNPDGNGFSYAAGMDLKYGINEAYTLDMTLIPDFGQRKSDDIILNLTPYEVKYRENRQFFTEGLDLFDKSGLFYSRRIGKRPEKYYDVYGFVNENTEYLENPEEAKLINATKISGRNNNNLGLGFFNALTANTYAKYKNPEFEEEKYLTEPFTNYNMIVADQILGRNSYVNIANTNVFTPSRSWTANVTGLNFKVSTKSNMYGITGNMAYSFVGDSAGSSPSTGYRFTMGAGKYGGKINTAYNISVLSDEYNPNHMGYLSHNNSISQDLSLSYRVLEPFSIFNNMSHSISLLYNQLFMPREYSRFGASLSSRFLFRNYWDFHGTFSTTPVNSHDWYEPRVSGRYFERPAYSEIDVGGSTDYRKKLAFNVGYEYRWNVEDERSWEISVQPRIRLSQKLSIFPRIELERVDNQIGYASYIDENHIVFGKRSVDRITNQITASYVFNNTMAVSLSSRHYWSAVDYTQYYLLNDNGRVIDYPENESNEDLNFNILTVDLEYSWNFAPGSFLTMVWKNQIYASQEIDDNIFQDYWDNFSNTIQSPQVNSFSVKLTYYLDYHSVIRPRLPFP
jgi:hypothetical protein